MNPNRKGKDRERVICFCYNVPESVIVDAIAKGCQSLMDIRRETYASTGCAGCTEEVKKLLRKHAGKIPQEGGEVLRMANPSGKKALFLDRDGTINIDPGYINHPSLIKLLPGAAAAIRRARDRGYVIAVISNQSGVGRGIIAPEMLEQINARLNELLREEAGGYVDYFACCTHRPDEECACRKPLPRLVYQAQAHLGISLQESTFIGDRIIDVKTGKSAPVRQTVLVRSGEGSGQEAILAKSPPAEAPDFIADDLAQAVDWVLARESVS